MDVAEWLIKDANLDLTRAMVHILENKERPPCSHEDVERFHRNHPRMLDCTAADLANFLEYTVKPHQGALWFPITLEQFKAFLEMLANSAAFINLMECRKLANVLEALCVTWRQYPRAHTLLLSAFRHPRMKAMLLTRMVEAMWSPSETLFHIANRHRALIETYVQGDLMYTLIALNHFQTDVFYSKYLEDSITPWNNCIKQAFVEKLQVKEEWNTIGDYVKECLHNRTKPKWYPLVDQDPLLEVLVQQDSAHHTALSAGAGPSRNSPMRFSKSPSPGGRPPPPPPPRYTPSPARNSAEDEGSPDPRQGFPEDMVQEDRDAHRQMRAKATQAEIDNRIAQALQDQEKAERDRIEQEQSAVYIQKHPELQEPQGRETRAKTKSRAASQPASTPARSPSPDPDSDLEGTGIDPHIKVPPIAQSPPKQTTSKKRAKKSETVTPLSELAISRGWKTDIPKDLNPVWNTRPREVLIECWDAFQTRPKSQIRVGFKRDFGPAWLKNYDALPRNDPMKLPRMPPAARESLSRKTKSPVDPQSAKTGQSGPRRNLDKAAAAKSPMATPAPVSATANRTATAGEIPLQNRFSPLPVEHPDESSAEKSEDANSGSEADPVIDLRSSSSDESQPDDSTHPAVASPAANSPESGLPDVVARMLDTSPSPENYDIAQRVWPGRGMSHKLRPRIRVRPTSAPAAVRAKAPALVDPSASVAAVPSGQPSVSEQDPRSGMPAVMPPASQMGEVIPTPAGFFAKMLYLHLKDRLNARGDVECHDMEGILQEFVFENYQQFHMFLQLPPPQDEIPDSLEDTYAYFAGHPPALHEKQIRESMCMAALDWIDHQVKPRIFRYTRHQKQHTTYLATDTLEWELWDKNGGFLDIFKPNFARTHRNSSFGIRSPTGYTRLETNTSAENYRLGCWQSRDPRFPGILRTLLDSDLTTGTVQDYMDVIDSALWRVKKWPEESVHGTWWWFYLRIRKNLDDWENKLVAQCQAIEYYLKIAGVSLPQAAAAMNQSSVPAAVPGPVPADSSARPSAPTPSVVSPGGAPGSADLPLRETPSSPMHTDELDTLPVEENATPMEASPAGGEDAEVDLDDCDPLDWTAEFHSSMYQFEPVYLG